MEPNAPLNLMILGKKQAGKSSSANTILGQEAFDLKNRGVAEKYSTVDGIPINVFDTPGFCDPELSDEEIKKIYEDIFQKCDSGPCAFLLVINAETFTEEEKETVEKIEELLGENRLKKTWIIFTGVDKHLDMTIKEFLDRNKGLKTLVDKYDQRFHVFNNKMRRPSEQAKLLLLNIHQKSLGLKNGGRMTRHISVQLNDEPESPADRLSSRRIVLLGKSGAGKSAAGNTILGQKEFKSDLCMASVTSECSERHATVSGRLVSVVDTPGLFDTQMTHEEIMMEIAKSVYLSSPGPHAFLIVFPVNMRFTEHEQQIPQIIEIMFGQEVLKYSIILFTHGDLLKQNNIEDLINGNIKLRHLVQQCGGRFHVFNNEDANNREQNIGLLQKIDTMIEQNYGYYSNQMYEDAYRFRQLEEERRRREEEERKLQVEKQIQEETERLMKEKLQRIREEMEVKQREEEERKLQEEKQRQEETDRLMKEKEQKIREEMEAKQRSELERVKVERQREEEERKQQEEKQRREEMERIRKETEKRIRVEMEVKNKEEQQIKLQEEKQRQEETDRLMKEKEQKIREEMEAKQRSELERDKAERQREEEQRKQQEEKQKQEEMEIVRKEIEKKVRADVEEQMKKENMSHTKSDPGIAEFVKEYEQELNISASAVNKSTHTGFGAIIGGVIGGAVGLLAGPAGAAAGASIGAAAGAATGAVIGNAFS